MAGTRVIKNEDISQAIIAVPEGHSHLRLALTTKDGDTVILQEAALAAVVRAYTTLKTHPVKRAVKLVSVKPVRLKEGYAKDQLLEVELADPEVAAELSALLDAIAR